MPEKVWTPTVNNETASADLGAGGGRGFPDRGSQSPGQREGKQHGQAGEAGGPTECLLERGDG